MFNIKSGRFFACKSKNDVLLLRMISIRRLTTADADLLAEIGGRVCWNRMDTAPHPKYAGYVAAV